MPGAVSAAFSAAASKRPFLNVLKWRTLQPTASRKISS